MGSESQLVMQFLERVIDEHIASAEKLTHIKFLQQEQRSEVSEILKVLKNGLKDDLKNHFSKEIAAVRHDYEKLSARQDELFKELDQHRERAKGIDAVLKDIQKKGLWFRSIIVLIVSLATIAGGFVTLMRVTGWGKETSPTPIVTPQHQPSQPSGSPPQQAINPLPNPQSSSQGASNP